MDRFEEVVIWVITGLFSVTGAVVGYLYNTLMKRIENIEGKVDTTDHRVDDQAKVDIKLKGDIDRMEEKLSGQIERLGEKVNSHQHEILLRLDHLKEIAEAKEKQA